MGQFRPLSARRVGPRRRGVSTFGLVLIVLGLIALLVTYSFLPGWVPRFWPLLIVAIGLLGLFRRPTFVTELDTLVPGLAGTADLAQHDMARITFQFIAFEHRG